jgi:hypothetical protein
MFMSSLGSLCRETQVDLKSDTMSWRNSVSSGDSSSSRMIWVSFLPVAFGETARAYR